jgi:hypothetical protein
MPDYDFKPLHLPCGGVAEFDGDFSYRCWSCMAVVGSIGQSQHCKDEAKKYENWEAMGGKGWNYKKGCPEA